VPDRSTPDRVADSDLELVHAIRELTVALDLEGAAFAAERAMHPTDVRALIALLDREREGGVATPGWLGDRLRLNSASVTALVDRMSARREGVGPLVERHRDPVDRRRVILRVTDDARAMGWEFFGPLIGRVMGVVADLSVEHRQVVRAFLREVTEAVRTEPGDDRHLPSQRSDR
jgi:DNA-binding MarR family transcriptional regulator